MKVLELNPTPGFCLPGQLILVYFILYYYFFLPEDDKQT